MYISWRKHTEKFVSSFEMERCELTESHEYADLPQPRFLSCTKKKSLMLYVNQLFNNQQDPDSGGFPSAKSRKKDLYHILTCGQF